MLYVSFLLSVFILVSQENSAKGSCALVGTAQLTVAPETTTLWIRRSNVTEVEAHRLLEKFERLEELTIMDCPSFEGFPNDGRLAGSLIKLTILNSPVGDDVINFVGRCSKLESLRLQNCHISSHAFEQLRLPETITTFSVSGMPFNDKAFESLAAYPKLNNVSLEHSAVSDKGVMAAMPRLHIDRISFSGSLISDSSVESIAHCTSLSTVRVSYTNICSSGVAKLCACPNISTIDVSGIHLDSDAVRALAECNVELLIAKNCLLSGKRFEELLLASKSIKSIWLSESDLMPSAVDALRLRFPDVAFQMR